MSSTFLELRTAVMHNTLSPARFDTLVGRWVNDAVADVCRRLRIADASEIAAYDANGVVTLATNFWRVREVWSVRTGTTGVNPVDLPRRGNYKLSPAPFASGLMLSPTVGQPMYYKAVMGAAGVLLTVLPPGIAGQVAVVGYARPALMVGDTDVSGLSPDLDEALIAFARARAFRREDDLNLSQMWEAEYVQRLRSVLPAHIQHSDGPNVTPGYEDSLTEPYAGGG